MPKYKKLVSIRLRFTKWRVIAGLLLYTFGFILAWPTTLSGVIFLALSSILLVAKLEVKEETKSLQEEGES